MCALAATGGLTPGALTELKLHLEKCGACREKLSQYRALGTQGLPALAGSYGEMDESQSWDESASWKKLLARLCADQEPSGKTAQGSSGSRFDWLRRICKRWFSGTGQKKPSSSGSV
jgi:hypothetical protein